MTRSRKEILQSSARGILTRSGRQTNKEAPSLLIEAQPIRTRISGGKAYKTASDKSDSNSNTSRVTKAKGPVDTSRLGGTTPNKTSITPRSNRSSELPATDCKAGKTRSSHSTPVQDVNSLFQRVPLKTIQPVVSGVKPNNHPPTIRSFSHHAPPDLVNSTNISEGFIKSIIARWSPKWFDECGKKIVMSSQRDKRSKHSTKTVAINVLYLHCSFCQSCAANQPEPSEDHAIFLPTPDKILFTK